MKKYGKKSGFFEKFRCPKTPQKPNFGSNLTSFLNRECFFDPPGSIPGSRAPRNTSFMKNLSFYSSFCNFRPEFRPIFLRYSHSLYKTHTADLPVSSLPIGISHTTLPEPPWTPLIRSGLHFISGKPIANSHSGRRRRGLGGGIYGSPTK